MSKYLTPSRHYIRIPNELIADRTLPEMVRVLYCIMAYLLSIPGFVITIGALRKYTGKSAATISAALSVLRKHGYHRQYRSCCSGKWVWAYVLFSEPQNDGLNAIQQTRQLPSSKYVAPNPDIPRCQAVSSGARIFILHPKWSICFWRHMPANQDSPCILGPLLKCWGTASRRFNATSGS